MNENKTKHITNDYITPEKASQLLKVTTRTLQLWSNDGKINSFRTKGHHRRFLLSDIQSIISARRGNEECKNGDNRTKICYCRVSTHSQKEDLERQVSYFKQEYPTHTIIKDIGSGLSFKRKGFSTLLDKAIKGDISEIVVTHRDRLCRFGFELIERILFQNGNGKIVVLNQEKTSPNRELVNDLISIVTVFSSRIHGLRSHSIKKKIKTATEGEDGGKGGKGGKENEGEDGEGGDENEGGEELKNNTV
jgi:excisionase family DNA binding protein